MPQVDFSGIVEFTPIPEGTYDATLTSGEVVAEAKTSKKPYVSLTFTVLNGEYAGRKLFRNFSLQPQALWAFKQAMVRLGVDGDILSRPMEFDELTALIAENTGAQCQVDVGLREYQGELRNELRKILEPVY